MLKLFKIQLSTTHFCTALLVYLQFVFPNIRTLELSTLGNLNIAWSKYLNYIQNPKWSPLFDINYFYLYTLTYAAISLVISNKIIWSPMQFPFGEFEVVYPWSDRVKSSLMKWVSFQLCISFRLCSKLKQRTAKHLKLGFVAGNALINIASSLPCWMGKLRYDVLIITRWSFLHNMNPPRAKAIDFAKSQLSASQKSHKKICILQKIKPFDVFV